MSTLTWHQGFTDETYTNNNRIPNNGTDHVGMCSVKCSESGSQPLVGSQPR